MRAFARDCLHDFCRVARRYAASVTATVKIGRVHSSRRRGRVGKALLKAGALRTASAVAGSAEPAQGNVSAGSHLPHVLTHLTPITARHVLAVVPADTNLIDATAGVTETVTGERMGAVNPPCPCPLLSVCCLRAFAGTFARCPSSLRTILGAIESPRPRCTRGRAARGPRRAWRGARARHARDRLGASRPIFFHVGALSSRDPFRLWK